jgi:hypothetical protein
MPECADVIPRLSKRINAPYRKDDEASKEPIPPLVDCLETAEANAEWVRNYHKRGETDFPCNPSTEVDRLISSIRKAKSPATTRSDLC